MNGYVCFYKGKRIEVYAETTYRAQQLAAAKLSVSSKNQHLISVALAEKDGEQVTHKPEAVCN